MFSGEVEYIGHKCLCHLLKVEFNLEMKSDKENRELKLGDLGYYCLNIPANFPRNFS